MEKFIYLFRGGGRLTSTPEEWKPQMQKWGQCIQSLQQKGVYVSGDPLQGSGRQVNGTKKIVTDGPFTEAKEMVGGYVIVNANDIDHAVEIAKDCPIFDEDGKLEVRPVQKMG
jgi:hypothetical protein